MTQVERGLLGDTITETTGFTPVHTRSLPTDYAFDIACAPSSSISVPSLSLSSVRLPPRLKGSAVPGYWG